MVSLMYDKREFQSLPADGEESELGVMWWRFMIMFEEWYERRSLVGVGANQSKFGGK